MRTLENDSNSLLMVRDIQLNPNKRIVTKAGKYLPTTLKEYYLLELFLRHPNEALSRKAITEEVWHVQAPCQSNVLDVHMKNLRRKLETDTTKPLFTTVRGVGYQLKTSV